MLQQRENKSSRLSHIQMKSLFEILGISSEIPSISQNV